MATEAAWLNKEQTHGKKKEKVCLDINRPSHGRTCENSEAAKGNIKTGRVGDRAKNSRPGWQADPITRWKLGHRST